MATSSDDAIEITPALEDRPEEGPRPPSPPPSAPTSAPPPPPGPEHQPPSKQLTLDTQLLSGRTTPDGGASLHRQEAKIETATTASIIPANPTLTKIPRMTVPLPQSRHTEHVKHEKTHDLHSDLHWEISSSNPRNWTRAKKWWHSFVVCAVAWVVLLASSVMAPAHNALMNQLNTTYVVAVLPTSIYLLGLTCGPIMSSALVEIYGTKNVYAMCIPFFSSFILASALIKNDYGLIILRFFAGVFGSPGLHAGYGTLSDMWTPERQNVPLTVYLSLAFLGSTLGPVLGGYLTWKMGWSWTQFVILFAFAGCVVPMLSLHETSKKSIFRRRKEQTARAPITKDYMLTICLQPFRMLYVEPIVLGYTIYSAFNFGVLYAIYTAFPGVFSRRAGFSVGAQGLAFIGMSTGVIIGFAVIIGWEALLYDPAAEKHTENAINEEEQGVRSRSGEKKLTGSGSMRPQSALSQSGIQKENRRSSLMRRLNALRNISTGRSSSTKSFSASPFRNYKLALAAAEYLNENNSEGQFIVPEQVLALLEEDMDYDELCKTLQSSGLKMNRVEFAQVLVDSEKSGTPDSTGPSPSGSALAAAIEQHRRATLVALGSSDGSFISPSAASSTIVNNKRTTWLPPANVLPPPEWRLWLALPASFLLMGSLFMLGWTARAGVHFMAPIVAFSIFAFSSLLIFVSLTQYIVACYSSSEVAHAVAICTMAMCTCAFVFPLFTLPMYRGILAGWATSVFAFTSIILGFIPALLYWFGPQLRQKQNRRYNS
jgi:MFS family permease